MNADNKKILWSEILKAGDYLKNKLPHDNKHPKGRNSYAHIALEIKNEFKNSYKDIDDDKFKKVINFIEKLKKNIN